MTVETVLLLFYLGCACIALRTLWLIHAPVALALTALLKAAGRYMDSTGKRTAEPDVIAQLEKGARR